MKIIIMAGGSGTRFWPKSVSALPKQFLALTSERTMIQETYERFRDWLPKENIFFVTLEQYAELVLKQIKELTRDQIIVEPEPRDTGPCIAITALYFLNRGDDEVLVTVPSDHYISDASELRRVLEMAEMKARQTACIVTLGVPPNRPETGYGYMKVKGSAIHDQLYEVDTFIEKPSIDMARRLIEKEQVYWNSGIFIWKPSTIEHFMKNFQQSMWTMLTGSEGDNKERYAKLPKISVDYAIMEKADEIYCIPVSFMWDDLGQWSSMERTLPTDENGNLLQGDILALDTKNTTVISENKRTIVIGADDLVVVCTEHGLLVYHKSEEHKVKKILQQIEP